MTQSKILYYSELHNEYATLCHDLIHASVDCQDMDPTGNLSEQMRGVQVVVDIGGRAASEIIDAAEDVRLWQGIGTGLDHCEVNRILDKGIALSHTPGFTSAYGLAESAMMYILMLTRKYHTARANFDTDMWFEPNGKTVDGMVLGIIGYGASGRQLAKRAKSFGMRIEAIDIRPLEEDLADEYQPDFYGTPDDMDQMIARSDVLSVHLHLTPETKHIIDRRRLSLMKRSALVINVARGALIDEEALAEAVLEEKLGGAGVDVFSVEPADAGRPEYQLPNFVVTPHTSGQTDETVRRRCAIAVDNIRRLAQGEELLHTVDASMGLGKV